MLKLFAEEMWVPFAVQKLLTFFSAKYIRILYIKSTKTFNEMVINDHVKLTTLWTTGPRTVRSWGGRIFRTITVGISIIFIISSSSGSSSIALMMIIIIIIITV